MRRDDSGWRLAAGSLCFPSSWSLVEKFGRPLQEIHAPVPGFGPGTRPAELINRMFDGLQGQAVERFNWSIQADDALYQPLSNVERIDRATSRPSRFPMATSTPTPSSASSARRCANCRYRATSCSPSASISTRWPCWRGIRIGQRSPRPSPRNLLALDEAQLDYKGLTSDRDRLVVRP